MSTARRTSPAPFPWVQCPDDYRRRFTLVLKGMIAISTLRFPQGTTGAEIDAFARSALWKAGLDYGHGTGHGVGSYLSVHEGPQRIAKTGRQELLPGMILSNEPGYYKPGEYGIRIENLIVVTEPRMFRAATSRCSALKPSPSPPSTAASSTRICSPAKSCNGSTPITRGCFQSCRPSSRPPCAHGSNPPARRWSIMPVPVQAVSRKRAPA